MMSAKEESSRLLKNAHLRRFPHPSSLRRTGKYASLLWISGALDLDVFEQPAGKGFFSNLNGAGKETYHLREEVSPKSFDLPDGFLA
jgi:hypothetical protein